MAGKREEERRRRKGKENDTGKKQKDGLEPFWLPVERVRLEKFFRH